MAAPNFANDRFLIFQDDKEADFTTSLLLGAGASRTMVGSVDKAERLQKSIEQNPPQWLIVDFLNKYVHGIDVCEWIRTSVEGGSRVLTILITGTEQEESIGRGAEEFVDVVARHPLTSAGFKQDLIAIKNRKLKTQPYYDLVAGAKALLANNQPGPARDLLANTLDQVKDASLALVYLAKCHFALGDKDDAIEVYREALKDNPYQLQALFGQYEVLNSQGKYAEAYDSIEKLTEYLPYAEKYQLAMAKVLIRSRSFDRIDEILHKFRMIHGTPEFRNTLCTLYVLSSKVAVQEGKGDKLKGDLSTAADLCEDKVSLFREIVALASDHNLLNTARKALKNFPSDERKSETFQVLDYLVACMTSNDHMAIRNGQLLVDKGIKDPLLYKKIYISNKKVGHEEEANKILELIKQDFPDQEEALTQADFGKVRVVE